MAIKLAINGYGRIGRNILRALYEQGREGEAQIVAINDLGDAKTNAHLTRHDSTHGPFGREVSVEDGDLVVASCRHRSAAVWRWRPGSAMAGIAGSARVAAWSP